MAKFTQFNIEKFNKFPDNDHYLNVVSSPFSGDLNKWVFEPNKTHVIQNVDTLLHNCFKYANLPSYYPGHGLRTPFAIVTDDTMFLVTIESNTTAEVKFIFIVDYVVGNTSHFIIQNVCKNAAFRMSNVFNTTFRYFYDHVFTPFLQNNHVTGIPLILHIDMENTPSNIQKIRKIYLKSGFVYNQTLKLGRLFDEFIFDINEYNALSARTDTVFNTYPYNDKQLQPLNRSGNVDFQQQYAQTKLNSYFVFETIQQNTNQNLLFQREEFEAIYDALRIVSKSFPFYLEDLEKLWNIYKNYKIRPHLYIILLGEHHYDLDRPVTVMFENNLITYFNRVKQYSSVENPAIKNNRSTTLIVECEDMTHTWFQPMYSTRNDVFCADPRQINKPRQGSVHLSGIPRRSRYDIITDIYNKTYSPLLYGETRDMILFSDYYGNKNTAKVYLQNEATLFTLIMDMSKSSFQVGIYILLYFNHTLKKSFIAQFENFYDSNHNNNFPWSLNLLDFSNHGVLFCAIKACSILKNPLRNVILFLHCLIKQNESDFNILLQQLISRYHFQPRLHIYGNSRPFNRNGLFLDLAQEILTLLCDLYLCILILKIISDWNTNQNLIFRFGQYHIDESIAPFLLSCPNLMQIFDYI